MVDKIDLLHDRGKIGLNANDEHFKGRKRIFNEENLHHAKNHEIFRYNYDPNSVSNPQSHNLPQRRHQESITRNSSNGGYLYPEFNQSTTAANNPSPAKLDLFHSNNPQINQ
jgi:hypothetical protein